MLQDEKSTVIKEGFLVKKGHVVQNWKVRWFVLLPDKLLYYRPEGGRKDSTTLKGQIPLEECSIICPCLEYENRPLVIKLKCKTSTEHFLEACSREERDQWAAEITSVISSISPTQAPLLQTTKQSILPSNISLNHIIDTIRDSNKGIKTVSNMEQGTNYAESFTGSAMVDWLLSTTSVTSRFEAVTLACLLLEENFIKAIGIKSTEAARNGDLGGQFLDDSTALYSFAESYKNKNNSKPELLLSAVELGGKIVKQGYLLKQGHKRKNWKMRRFVLRTEPAYLHYYDPTKDTVHPVGGFPLRGCLISALEDNGVPSGVKGNVQGNLFKIITQKDVHYYIQASSKGERTEWIEAIKQQT
ncbi:pleckstrin-2 [Protopterus annectens]|uniref:pleckstrin-2 n=1 Tax=Protopterus annectens TaxID=7888 RepID=UPI001CFAAB60|nr:pleckstrin-2 [Protopterus annectens]